MANTEKVTGPSNGMIPLVLVIGLALATWFGTAALHKKWFNHPLNPLGKTEQPAAH